MSEVEVINHYYERGDLPVGAPKGRHLRITEKVSKAEVGRIIDELICRKPKNGVASYSPKELK